MKFHLRLPEGRTTVPISTLRLLSPVIGKALVVFVCQNDVPLNSICFSMMVRVTSLEQLTVDVFSGE